MVTTKFSLPYYKEIVDEYIKHGFNEIQIKFMSYLGDAKEVWNKIGYNADEFINFWKANINL